MSGMELESNRLLSFTATRTRRFNLPSHSAWPLSPSTHPNLTPALLARAGWFFTPSKASPDQVTCFLCRKSLGGWEEGDDAFEEHVGHGGGCAWAETRCRVELARRRVGAGAGKASAGKERLEGEADGSADALRKTTFAKSWALDRTRGARATSATVRPPLPSLSRSLRPG